MASSLSAVCVSVLLLVIGLEAVAGQGQIGFDLPCGEDNLSCPRFVNISQRPLECYVWEDLCDGVEFCEDGTDEGRNIVSLECNSEDPINSEFVCTPGNNIAVTLLCDGFNDCGNGNDETTVLCENKCRVPYYGGCSFTRECITSEADVNCGDCLPGFMEDPNNTTAGADCIPVPDDKDCEEETRTRTRSRSRSRSQSSRSSSRRSSRSRSSSDSSRSSSSTTSRRGTKCKKKTGTRYTTPRRVIQQQNLSNNYYWSKILRKLHGLEY